MNNHYSQIQYFDRIREELLVSLYTNDSKGFDKTFSELIKKLEPLPAFSENVQKALYQILVITKKFNKKKEESALSLFLKKRTVLETENPATIDYDTWKKSLGINDTALEILFSTTANFQLTTGCSNFCRRCNEWALPGARKHFSHDAVLKIAHQLARAGNKDYALYSASDPLDWEDKSGKEDFNITDLITDLKSKDLLPSFGLLTKIPKGKEGLFKKLIKEKADISASITSLNREKLKKIEKSLGIIIHKQHDTDDLLIPAGRDEDFSSIKSSITDSYGTEITPDGAFIVTPAFTSALNPTGQKRIEVNENTAFFIKKMVGSRGLEFNYFDHLKVINHKSKVYILDYLLDSQIENLLLDNGEYEITPPGMISLKEYFETFMPQAVTKRRKMLESVKKRLRKSCSENDYKIKFDGYKNTCDQNHVTEMKKSVFKYFLSEIKTYLQKNNYKREIIYYLRKSEIESQKRKQDTPFSLKEISKKLNMPDSDTFRLFNRLVFILLRDPDNKLFSAFLKK